MPTGAPFHIKDDIQYSSVSEESVTRKRNKTLTFSIPLSTISRSKKCRQTRASSQRWMSTFWQSTTQDLKEIKWRTKPAFMYYKILPIVIIVALISAITLMAKRQDLALSGSICHPDGTINMYLDSYNPWNASEAFTINLAYGINSFKVVKMIDVAWDLFIGRGGQALMGLVSYRVLSSSLSQMMEVRSVSFGTFEAIMLQAGTTKALYKLIRDFRKNTSGRSKIIILVMMLTVILVLIFPTLASAMTGYTPLFDAEVTLPNNTSVHPNSLHRVWYIIHDGSRLGQKFHDDYFVVDSGSSEPYWTSADTVLETISDSDLLRWEQSRPQFMQGCSEMAPGIVNRNQTISLQSKVEDITGSNCNLLWEISRYAYTYDAQPNQTNTVFGKYYNKSSTMIPGPPLNITMLAPTIVQPDYTSNMIHMFESYDLAWAIVPYGKTWGDISVVDQVAGLLPPEDMNSTTDFFSIPGSQPSQAMSMLYLFSNAHCRQQGPGEQTAVQYQWGFAYQPLFMCFVLLLAWMICICYLSIHTSLYTTFRSHHRSVGLRRAILDIAPKYQEHLDSNDMTMSNDDEIRKLVRDGTITYADLNATNRNFARRRKISIWWTAFRFKKWVREEWKWLTTGGVLCTLWILGGVSSLHYNFGSTVSAFDDFYHVYSPRLGWIPCAGVLVVLFVGRLRYSRWLWFALSVLIFVPLQIFWYTSQIDQELN